MIFMDIHVGGKIPDVRYKKELARQVKKELDKLMGLAEVKKRSETALLNEKEADGEGTKGEK